MCLDEEKRAGDPKRGQEASGRDGYRANSDAPGKSTLDVRRRENARFCRVTRPVPPASRRSERRIGVMSARWRDGRVIRFVRPFLRALCITARCPSGVTDETHAPRPGKQNTRPAHTWKRLARFAMRMRRRRPAHPGHASPVRPLLRHTGNGIRVDPVLRLTRLTPATMRKRRAAAPRMPIGKWPPILRQLLSRVGSASVRSPRGERRFPREDRRNGAISRRAGVAGGRRADGLLLSIGRRRCPSPLIGGCLRH